MVRKGCKRPEIAENRLRFITGKGEKKMKKWFAVVAGLFFGIALLTTGAGAQQFTIKYAVSSPPDSFHQAYADKFKELCEKYSGGKIKVNVYGGAQLGSE
ncbi:MAG: hypothetical protein AMJ94_16485, partial [Deltaproteobacteria bacterium SM23_61]